MRKILTTPLKIKIMNSLREQERVVDVARKLNVPRDTVKPHIRSLSDMFLIEKADKGYRLTGVGEVLLDRVTELESLMELIEKHGEFFATHDLSSIPEELLRDLHMLKDCRVYTKDNPFQIQQDWADVGKKSKWTKIVYPIFHSEPLHLYNILENKGEVKFIVVSEVLEDFRTQRFDLLKKCMEVAEFYVCERATGCFWVSDRQLTLYLFMGRVIYPLNVLICNCKEGIEWGVRLFDYYLKKSVRIEEM